MAETQVKATYTPGPWGGDYNSSPIIVSDANGEAVVYIHARRTLSEERANARLIAAATDSFEALTACRAQWIHSVNAEQCLAAIAKATGGEG